MPFIVLDPGLAAVVPPPAVGAPIPNRGETLISFEQELNNLLGGRDDVDPARLCRWVNAGYLDLATSLKIDELKSSYGFSTTAGQALYSIPSQVFSTIGAFILLPGVNMGGAPLEKISLDGYRSEPANSGDPLAYFRHNNLLVLHSTPDGVYTIGVDFWVRPDFMVGDTDSPILNLEWHEAILLSARKKAFSALKMFEAAMAAENDYVNHVRRRRDASADEDDYRTPTARPVRNHAQMRFRSAPGLMTPEPE